jgi:hypothetical protein
MFQRAVFYSGEPEVIHHKSGFYFLIIDIIYFDSPGGVKRPSSPQNVPERPKVQEKETE